MPLPDKKIAALAIKMRKHLGQCFQYAVAALAFCPELLIAGACVADNMLAIEGELKSCSGFAWLNQE